MELLLSKLLEKGTEGPLDEAITKRDIQAVVDESRNPESEEANTNNQETTDK